MPISADAAVSQLQMAIAPGVRYIDGGWQTLVDGLLAVCESRGVRVETKSPVVSVRTSGGGVEVDAGTGHWTAKAAVIAGLGPANATSLLGGDAVWGDLGETATAACLDLGLTRPPSHPVGVRLRRPAVPLDALSACRSRARTAARSSTRCATEHAAWTWTGLARRARCRRRHRCFDDRDRALPRAHERRVDGADRITGRACPVGRPSRFRAMTVCSSPATGWGPSGCCPTRLRRAR